MLLITGMQRCGTSVLASYLYKLGYDLGTKFWHDEINGGLESPDICKEYQKFLDDKLFPFNDFNNSVEKREYTNLNDLNYQVQKFSFLLMNSNFVDYWYDCRGNSDNLLILIRETENIFKSKKKDIKRYKRFLKDHNILKQTSNEMKINFYDSFLKIIKYDFNFCVLKFPDYLEDYFKLYNTLRKLNFNIKYDKEGWYNYIDMKKVSYY